MEIRAKEDLFRSRLDELVRKYKLADAIAVTRPTMPSLDKYREKLQGIWDRRWLTNDGELHYELEQRLAKYLDLEHLALFCNGTIALLVALQSLRIQDGEVITTPFTFPATPHVLYWNRIRPVFCDIDERTCTLDPNHIERLVSPETKAILAVHVYGLPCDVESIQNIADNHGLSVIYDAAHAFGVRYKGRPLASYGDISVLSFHATKLFTTGEGGALICGSEAQKQRINFLKNFGIADEETVIGPGINGKMNEFQAAFGLLQLESVDEEIERRGRLSKIYREELRDMPGITCLAEDPDTTPNYAYFPVLVDQDGYGMSRDDLHTLLKEFNIFVRKYFHPLCSHYSCYSSLPSAAPQNLPVAERISRQVLCLPMYGDLEERSAQAVCEVIGKLHEAGFGA